MTHVRLWRFEVAPGLEHQFIAAYRSDGDWARLFATEPGFVRTELWRDGDGIYLTADYWESASAFERFQAGQASNIAVLTLRSRMLPGSRPSSALLT